MVNAAGVVLEVSGAAADFERAEIARAERTRRGDRLTVTVRRWDGGVHSRELNGRRAARLDPVLGRYPARWWRRCRSPPSIAPTASSTTEKARRLGTRGA
ncbi:hypothetical protein ACWEN3_38540 [Streptomyces sp. NPDC004561]